MADPAPVPTRRPDPSRRNEATRLAILDAAIEELAEQGYGELSIEAMARRAGVGKQTIYRWWPSKGAVLLEAFLERRVEARTGGGEFQLDTGHLATDIRRFLKATTAEFANPDFAVPYRAIVVAAETDPALRAEIDAQLSEPSRRTLVEWLTAARKRGQLRADIAIQTAVDIVAGPLSYRWLMQLAPLNARFARDHAEAAIRALDATD